MSSPTALLESLLAKGEFAGHPLTILAVMCFFALLPMLALSLTSFLKLSVVFAMLRNALGAGQFPSAAVSSLLALVLTLHIMKPVAVECMGALAQAPPPAAPGASRTPELSALRTTFEDAARPVERFLRRHSRMEERLFFLGAADKGVPPSAANACPEQEPCALPGEGLWSLVPAFVLSELQEGFAIGFMLFLPFLVIEIVAANILAALGMVMVSPVTVSLPFKILLFVLCDGWFLLSRALVLGYQ